MCLLQSCSMVYLSPCQESWWTQRSPQLQLSWRICGGCLLSAFPQGLCQLLQHQLGLYNVSWRPTSSSSVVEHLGHPCHPYRVVAKSPKVFQLQLGSRVESVSVDRLKPCLSSEAIPAVPPWRGRPPLQSSESQPPASILGGPCRGQQIRQLQQRNPGIYY